MGRRAHYLRPFAMLIKSSIIGLLFTIPFISFAQPNQWVQKASVANGRAGAVAFTIGDKGYLGTGNLNNGTDDFWEFDPSTNIWTIKSHIGIERAYGIGFSIGNKGYVGLGAGSSDYKNDFWEFDPANNTWTQKASFPGGARRDAVAFSIGGKGYVGTGYEWNSDKSDFWEYDPLSNTWTQKGDFTAGVRSAAIGFVIGNKGYLGLGFGGYGPDGGLKNDLWEYDPSLDSWTRKADFPNTGRSYATGFCIGSKGYVGLGLDGLINRKDFWEYDPAHNTWTQVADYTGLANQSATGFSINGKGYMGTGYGNGPVGDIWEYTPFSFAIPITFLSLKAYQKNEKIVVEWKTSEDSDTKEYQVEKSVDARNYYRTSLIAAFANSQVSNYAWQDVQPSRGMNYYRIKSVAVNGNEQISRIVSVYVGDRNDQISIYPNPVTTNIFTLNIVKNTKDIFTVKLFSSSGQLVKVYSVSHPGGSSSQTLELPASSPNDLYLLNIYGVDGKQTKIKVYISPIK